MTLFDPAEHEPLEERPWDEASARAAIGRIVADAEAAFDPKTFWPGHPHDEDPADPLPEAPTGLYFGAAGVIWALDYLQEEGAVTLSRDYDPITATLHGRYVEQPDEGEDVPSYLFGQIGILLLQYKLDPRPETADLLEEQIRLSIPRPENELLYGAPGGMLAALTMLAWTSEARWRELWLAAAGHVWAGWDWQDDLACHLWTQELVGKSRRFLGPAHGFAGNAYALLRGSFLLPAHQQLELVHRIGTTLERTAMREDGLTNWPPVADETPAPPFRVQWCHGAPGMICSLVDSTVSSRELLREGEELVWKAGPVAKGSSLCHGTAGNGYTFLKTRRLRRAEAFAMHAIAQCEDARGVHGQGRYTLWSGDLGLAVYLWHCIQGEASVPVIDVF